MSPPLTAALSARRSSKSPPGSIFRNWSATRAILVSLTSTATMNLLFLPSGVYRPFGIAEYRMMWRRWASVGLEPQKTTRSARFFTSPRVVFDSPTCWRARMVGPWQTEEVLSTTPPESSASSTALPMASHSVELRP